MIDVHCHLEQPEFDRNLKTFVEEWKKELKFVVSSCSHPQDLKKSFEIYQQFKPFVKICVGIHPEYAHQVKEEEIEKVINFIEKNERDISAIGEIGLDYYCMTEELVRKKQENLFLTFIELAKKLEKPVVVHARNSFLEVIEILEKKNMQGRKVLMHLMTEKKYVERIVKNSWFLSLGPGILKSKNQKKVARDVPLQNLMLETDSPWFAQPDQKFGVPLNVKIVCKKIAEIKKLNEEEIEKITDINACKFFL
ncbi:MAG: TatD family hydrolase [Candidatus Pacearchaeota archaeon]|nr:TatD family hydrolase [Candidatus Pacearchaeota archaeon]